MKELRDILSALERAQSGPLVLATVVAVEGSTYRRPGARMLVLPEGRIGAISGGCLEDEVCKKAWWHTERGPAVLTYDTGLDDAESGYGLGCRGRVTVLMERIDPASPPEYLNLIRSAHARGSAAVVATVVGVAGDSRFGVGERMDSVLGAANRPAGLADDAESALNSGRSRLNRYAIGSGHVDIFIEVIPPPIHVMVFGSGHDAEPVVHLSRQLGWNTTVLARRLSAHAAARFAAADRAIQISDESIAAVLGQNLSSRSAAIIMSHNYEHDLDALRRVTGSSIAYIGILGPRHRTDSLLKDLSGAGAAMSPVLKSRIHAPVGLDIGAESPEQVALAIIAEVQAFYADRIGGPLRDRTTGIHERIQAPALDQGSLRPACGLDP